MDPAWHSHQCLSFLLLQSGTFLLAIQGLHGLGKALLQMGHCLSGTGEHRTDEQRGIPAGYTAESFSDINFKSET